MSRRVGLTRVLIGALFVGAMVYLFFSLSGRESGPLFEALYKQDNSVSTPLVKPKNQFVQNRSLGGKEKNHRPQGALSGSARDQDVDSFIESYRVQLALTKSCYQSLMADGQAHRGSQAGQPKESSVCRFPSRDPREYDWAVGRALAKLLTDLTARVVHRDMASSLLKEIALEYLQVDDGYVKEASLQLLATQPPSEDGLHSLIDNIVLYHDADLIPQGLLELKRYGSPQDVNLIHQSLAMALLQGSPFVAEAIAHDLDLFIDDGSYGIYSRLIPRLPAGSKTQSALRLVLQEYRRHKQKG